MFIPQPNSLLIGIAMTISRIASSKPIKLQIQLNCLFFVIEINEYNCQSELSTITQIINLFQKLMLGQILIFAKEIQSNLI